MFWVSGLGFWVLGSGFRVSHDKGHLSWGAFSSDCRILLWIGAHYLGTLPLLLRLYNRLQELGLGLLI